LEARQKWKKRKRVMLKDKSVFSMPEILDITMEAESMVVTMRKGEANAVQAMGISSDDHLDIKGSGKEPEGIAIA
jgi:hypothetical protein